MSTQLQKIALGDVAEIVSGGTPSTSNNSYWDGDLSWITPKDLSGYQFRYISKGERSITQEGLKNSSARLLPKDSVVFTTRAPIGYAAIASSTLATNQGFKSLVLKDGNDPRYFYYLLKNSKAYIEQFASGSTFKEISGSAFKRLEFFVPNKERQKEIADILSAFDDKIESNIRLNQKIDTFLGATFRLLYDAYSSDESFADIDRNDFLKSLRIDIVNTKSVSTTIGQIAEVVGGGTPSTKNADYFCTPQNGLPWITPKDLSGYSWKFISCGETNITKDGLSNSGAQMMPEGTVLFSSRAPIGYIAIASNPVTTNQGFKSLVPNKGYGTNFLFHLVKTITPVIESRASGSTFKEISGGALKETPITIPPADIAKKFEEFSLSFSLKQKLLWEQNKKLEQLKNIQIRQYFNGGSNASM